jgi:hypothetical protein
VRFDDHLVAFYRSTALPTVGSPPNAPRLCSQTRIIVQVSDAIASNRELARRLASKAEKVGYKCGTSVQKIPGDVLSGAERRKERLAVALSWVDALAEAQLPAHEHFETIWDSRLHQRSQFRDMRRYVHAGCSSCCSNPSALYSSLSSSMLWNPMRLRKRVCILRTVALAFRGSMLLRDSS